MGLMTPERYESAPDFHAYLATVEKNRDLWHGLWERASLPRPLLDAAATIPGPRRLLALSEDWCGDAVNALPWVARLAEASPELELRILDRDENLDLMDAHLTDGRSRSIPVVIAYDEAFTELGWWGPRPGELQRWVTGEGSDLSSEERYRRIRMWYARDRGWSVVRGILLLLGAEDPGEGPAAGSLEKVLATTG